jgi:hypothetical protein
MIETADNLAGDYDITREAADAYALRSQQSTAAARADNRFAIFLASAILGLRLTAIRQHAWRSKRIRQHNLNYTQLTDDPQALHTHQFQRR